MSDFDALLAEISGAQETLAKAMPADDDAKIAAAAGDVGAEKDASKEEEDKEDEEGEEDAPVFGKSFSVTLEDGSVVEAVDGAEMVKALLGRVETLEGSLTKALETCTALTTLNKSLATDVAALKGAPRPRKAILDVKDRPAAAAPGSGSDQLSPKEFLAKAQVAADAGRITAREHQAIDVSLRHGFAPDAELVRKVVEAS